MATRTSKHVSDAGGVLSDIASSAADGFRRAAKDAADVAQRTGPAIRHSVSKGTYTLAYCLSFGTVYTACVLAELLPEDGVIRQGLRDGAHAARRAHAEREVSATAEAVADAVP